MGKSALELEEQVEQLSSRVAELERLLTRLGGSGIAGPPDMDSGAIGGSTEGTNGGCRGGASYFGRYPAPGAEITRAEWLTAQREDELRLNKRLGD